MATPISALGLVGSQLSRPPASSASSAEDAPSGSSSSSSSTSPATAQGATRVLYRCKACGDRRFLPTRPKPGTEAAATSAQGPDEFDLMEQRVDEELERRIKTGWKPHDRATAQETEAALKKFAEDNHASVEASRKAHAEAMTQLEPQNVEADFDAMWSRVEEEIERRIKTGWKPNERATPEQTEQALKKFADDNRAAIEATRKAHEARPLIPKGLLKPCTRCGQRTMPAFVFV